MNTTPTTTPARVARRKLLTDRFAELLESWGSPHTAERARELLDAVDAAGFTLPAALDDTPPARPAHAGDHRPHLEHIRAVLADPNHPDRAPRTDA